MSPGREPNKVTGRFVPSGALTLPVLAGADGEVLPSPWVAFIGKDRKADSGSRAARISEIFGLLNDGPAGDYDQQIGLCREALALMTPEEAVSPAAGWLEFVAGKAFVKRAGTDRVADLTAAISSFRAALATWTPEDQLVNWAAAQTNLSYAYSDRHALTGSPGDEQAALEALAVGAAACRPPA